MANFNLKFILLIFYVVHFIDIDRLLHSADLLLI